MLCRQSEYFRKLCGPGSAFAESKQSEIEFADDDPDAFAAVVRHLYNAKSKVIIDVPVSPTEWEFYLKLRTTADKYLCHNLKISADISFRAVVRSTSDTTQIFHVIRTLQDEYSHDDALIRLAGELRKAHLPKLITEDGYRAYLNEDKERLWVQLDELASFATMEQKTVASCEKCPAVWWKGQAANHTATCTVKSSIFPALHTTERVCLLFIDSREQTSG